MIHQGPLAILGLSLIPPVGCGYSFGSSGLARQAKSVLLGGRYKGLQHQTQQNNITFCPSPPIYTCPLRTNEAKFTSTTPRFGACYEASDKGSVYATYSKGFKVGGFNPYSCNNPFDPEDLTSYEGGVKLRLLDRSLMLNFWPSLTITLICRSARCSMAIGSTSRHSTRSTVSRVARRLRFLAQPPPFCVAAHMIQWCRESLYR